MSEEPEHYILIGIGTKCLQPKRPYLQTGHVKMVRCVTSLQHLLKTNAQKAWSLSRLSSLEPSSELYTWKSAKERQ